MERRPRLRWQLRYVGPPYQAWTIREFTDERAAKAAFEELWQSHPPAMNLMLRSSKIDED